ncbi:MAG TPA: glycosyltransferase family 9 protein [Cyclobacteriaceae bacterium]
MTPRKLLVIRFSAMGDVVLLVPVLKSLLEAHSDVTITVVTRPRFAPFFAGIPRLDVVGADVDVVYRGLRGLRALARKLTALGPYEVAFDLHDHLRTMILRTILRLSGLRVVVFKKGRREKKELVRPHRKIVRPLRHTVDRYREAFTRSGFHFEMLPGPFLVPDEHDVADMRQWVIGRGLTPGLQKWIGIAPFANHRTKIWPGDYSSRLIDILQKRTACHFFLFGGGRDEIQFFEEIRDAFPTQCTIVAGTLDLRQEIALMTLLDLMVCVDSSNMHLAALAGTPLLSLWGGTHPYTGFGPYLYDSSAILQVDREELPCRPCSVYGKETCLRGDFACLYRLTPELVAQQIFRKLGL